MDVTTILEAVVTIAVALITGLLVPYLKEKYGAEKIKNAYDIIKILVSSAEQIITKSGQGKKKKELVLERLESYNIKIDESKVDEMIESAVNELNSKVGE